MKKYICAGIVVIIVILLFVFVLFKMNNKISTNSDSAMCDSVVGIYESDEITTGKLNIYSNGVAGFGSSFVSSSGLAMYYVEKTEEWLPYDKPVQYGGKYEFDDDILTIHAKNDDFILLYEEGNFKIKAGDLHLPGTKVEVDEYVIFKKITE